MKLGEYLTITDNKSERKRLVTADKKGDASKPAPSSGGEEEKFVVYANINNTEDDFTFLLTALYHWEEATPRFTHKNPKTYDEFKVYEAKRAKH
jgi:hypothetical protein